jgi:nucleoside-diphosphate-sugar epimerase
MILITGGLGMIGAHTARGEQPPLPHADDGGDISRLSHDTGFTPDFDILAAVADYTAWRADNPR